MPDSVTYNQIITLKKNNSIKCQIVKKSFTEKGKLILILEDLQKIIIDGKNIKSGFLKWYRWLRKKDLMFL